MKKFFITAFVFSSLALAQMNHDGHDMGGMGDASTKALTPLTGKAYDIAWMSQMIAHHNAAVQMSRDCIKVCIRPEVKKAAQSISDSQGKEVRQLEDWLKTWYNAKPDAKQMALMDADMQPMMDTAKMGMMPAKGQSKGTDKAFLEGMIPHHEHAVVMAQDALKKASKAELKKFARDVIAVQSKEIAQFKTWLKK
jgi:uncharacterized protein (DUF305 family)